jgi:hypothetical protein
MPVRSNKAREPGAVCVSVESSSSLAQVTRNVVMPPLTDFQFSATGPR